MKGTLIWISGFVHQFSSKNLNHVHTKSSKCEQVQIAVTVFPCDSTVQDV